MSQRIVSLGAFGFAALAFVGAPARASYTVTTKVGDVMVNGSAASVTVLPAGSPLTIAGSTIDFTNGGVRFSDGSGSTIYLQNQSAPENYIAAANEQVYVVTSGNDDTSSFTFTMTTSIDGTGAFSLGAGFALAVSGGYGASTITPGFPTAITVINSTINGVSYTYDQQSEVPGSVNTANNAAVGAIITPTVLANPNVIPEPASCLMLGLGLVAGLGRSLLRRGRSS